MTPPITLLLGLTLLLVAAVLLYGANLRYVVRHALPRRFPRAAVVPFVTPFHAWRLGARTLPLALATSMLLYGLFWVSAWAGGLS